MINISFGEHTAHFFIDITQGKNAHEIKLNLVKVLEKKI
jgi:hypothetical protein